MVNPAVKQHQTKPCRVEDIAKSCKRLFCKKPQEKTVVRLVLRKLREEFPKSSDRALGKALRKAFPNIKRNRPGSRKGRGEMCYYGISVKNVNPPMLPHKIIGNTVEKLKTTKPAKRNHFTDSKVPPHLHINRELLKLAAGEAGRGAFSQCLIGRYRGLTVAVKQFCNPRQLGTDGLRKEVLHEASMMLKLRQHPSLSYLIGVEITSTPFILLTQLHKVNGRPLSVFHALRNPSTGQPQQIDWKIIAEKLGNAVLAVHESGILHNDIKDDNVVLHFEDGQYSPVLIDFGKACPVAKGRKLRLLREEQEVWRERYRNLAPELVAGVEAESTSTDVYSFGYLVKCIRRKIKDSVLLSEVQTVCMNKSEKRASLPFVLRMFRGEAHV